MRNRPLSYEESRRIYILDQIIKEVQSKSEGKDISVSSITLDKEGYYNDSSLRNMINDLINAYPESAEKISESDKEYLRTLFYISIRAIQAGLNYIVVPGECGDLSPVHDDSFSSLLYNIKKSRRIFTSQNYEFQFDLGLTEYIPVSEDLLYTIFTLYEMLTGKTPAYVSPYKTAEELAIEKYGSVDIAMKKADENARKLDAFEPDPEELEEQFRQAKAYSDELDSSLMDAESIKAFLDDEKEIQDSQEYAKAVQLTNLKNRSQKKKYEEECRRIRLTFTFKDEFIKEFDHLMEMTSSGNYEEKESCLQNMVEGYLESHGFTVFSNPDLFEKVFDYINRAGLLIDKSRDQ